MTKKILVWFRSDLRLSDNPALYEACAQGAEIIPLYILDDENAGMHKMGAASRVWLHGSLQNLDESLKGHLIVRKGAAQQILQDILKDTRADAVFWNRCYEPWRISRDKKIKLELDAAGVEVQTFNASLLWEPWTIKNKSDLPYKVFTPFYQKGCLSAPPPAAPLPVPDIIFHEKSECFKGININELNLLPNVIWYKGLLSNWSIGEKFAKERLLSFLENGFSGYKEGRNFPSQSHTSRLSPYLHFGEISPRQIWHEIHAYAHINSISDNDLDCLRSELIWREFSHSLLYYNPDLPVENLQRKFDNFPWQNLNEDVLDKWHQGQTGYPIVDAAMRELWQTGYMHNRCRMIVGSFLVKHLRVDWRVGEAWFWDTLFDADLASNSASWQWIAGCGADAAPYFRIFNPITQGEKFDSKGEYTRKYVPELKNLPDKFLFAPWTAPSHVLAHANVSLGHNYPLPMVDHGDARRYALEAFSSLS